MTLPEIVVREAKKTLTRKWPELEKAIEREIRAIGVERLENSTGMAIYIDPSDRAGYIAPASSRFPQAEGLHQLYWTFLLGAQRDPFDEAHTSISFLLKGHILEFFMERPSYHELAAYTP